MTWQDGIDAANRKVRTRMVETAIREWGRCETCGGSGSNALEPWECTCGPGGLHGLHEPRCGEEPCYDCTDGFRPFAIVGVGQDEVPLIRVPDWNGVPTWMDAAELRTHHDEVQAEWAQEQWR